MSRVLKLAGLLLLFALTAVPAAAEGNDGIRALPVPVSTIPAGQIVGYADLSDRKFQTTPRSLMGIAMTAAEIAGLEARRTLQAGRPIPLSALTKPLAVRRGTKVTASYEETGFSISAQLMALEDGAAGDVITARNIDSGAIVRVTVLQDGKLAVIAQ
jgi:flagella basal body P-ring formation protein FlgA